VVPFGSGATVFYNYVDLRFVNPGPETYRLRLWLTDEELHGEVWADRLPPLTLQVREADHRFFRSEGHVYRENRLVRTAVDRLTGLPAGDEVVMHNVCPVLYEPGADVVVYEELPVAPGALRPATEPMTA
jgi:vancomycin resistance protein VanW